MKYVSIDNKFLQKNLKEANELSISELGSDDGKDLLRFDDLKTTIEELEIKENGIDVTVSNELGMFGLFIPLDSDDLVVLLQESIKKFNKIKAFMETMK